MGSPRRFCGTPEARFWAKVDRESTPDGCWPWTGFRTRKGYGQLNAGGARGRVRANRFALELALGRELGPDEVAMHGCDAPACCRVADGHIRLGTPLENIADRDAKGRQARGDRHGIRRLSLLRALGAPDDEGRVIARSEGNGRRALFRGAA